MKGMTSNEGRTDSEAEGGREEQTMEIQLQRQREAEEGKVSFFPIDFLLVLVIFCHYVTDRKLFYVT